MLLRKRNAKRTYRVFLLLETYDKSMRNQIVVATADGCIGALAASRYVELQRTGFGKENCATIKIDEIIIVAFLRNSPSSQKTKMRGKIVSVRDAHCV